VKHLAAIALLFFLLGTSSLVAQEPVQGLVVVQDSTANDGDEIDPLKPSKAAFYSAVLPGLGQAYNKKYWKIPLVYGAIGASIYSYSWNNTKYHNYRDAYKRRLSGYRDDDFLFLDDNRLISAQRFHQRNRDLSLLVAVGFYVLNIVDANIDAHLMQFNVNDNLSLAPEMYQNEITSKPNLAFTLNYKF
jgi:hypothetical protein